MESSLEKVASRDNIDKKIDSLFLRMTLISPKIKHIHLFLLDSFLTRKLVGSHKIKQIEQNPDDISIHISSFIRQVDCICNLYF